MSDTHEVLSIKIQAAVNEILESNDQQLTATDRQRAKLRIDGLCGYLAGLIDSGTREECSNRK